MMKNFIIAMTSLLTIQAMASIAGTIGVEGYVTAFDNDRIVIESGNQKVEIPRKMYTYKVKTGERITVEMDQKDFDKLKKENLKPATSKK